MLSVLNYTNPFSTVSVTLCVLTLTILNDLPKNARTHTMWNLFLYSVLDLYLTRNDNMIGKKNIVSIFVIRYEICYTVERAIRKLNQSDSVL